MSEPEGRGPYRVTLKIRRGPGYEVKPEAEEMDGAQLIVTRGWPMEAGLYEGETAWIIEGTRYPLTWVASGDLQGWEPVQ